MKILFWTSYSPDLPLGLNKVGGKEEFKDAVWGSEGSLVRLAKALVKLKQEVWIVGGTDHPMSGFLNSPHPSGLTIEDFDVVIIQRYLNYFIYEQSLAPKTVLWLHDVVPLWWIQGGELPDGGRPLYINSVKHNMLDKSVVLTPSHKNTIQSQYPIPDDHFEIIGHG